MAKQWQVWWHTLAHNRINLMPLFSTLRRWHWRWYDEPLIDRPYFFSRTTRSGCTKPKSAMHPSCVIVAMFSFRESIGRGTIKRSRAEWDFSWAEGEGRFVPSVRRIKWKYNNLHSFAWKYRPIANREKIYGSQTDAKIRKISQIANTI